MEPDNKKPHTPSSSNERHQPHKKEGADMILRPLRTYRGDVAFVLRKDKTSLIDISVAEHKRDRKREKLSEKAHELDKRIEEEGVKIRKTEEKLRKAESTWLSWFKKKPKEKAPEPKVKKTPPLAKKPEPSPPLSLMPLETPEKTRTLHDEILSRRSKTPKTPKPDSQSLTPKHGVDLSALKASKERAEQLKLELEQHRARLSVRAPMRFRPEKRESQVSKYLAIIGTIILLVGGGIGLGAITYNTFTNRNVVEPEATIPTFFPVNIQYEVQSGGLSRQDLMQALVLARDEVALATGDIAHLYLTRNLSGKAMLFSTFDLFDVLRLRIPDPLTRTLNKQFMLGVHRKETREPFLVLETSFFENAFPSMIAWEPFMNADLAPLFGQVLEGGPPVTFSPTAPSPFIDLVINNKDARVLYDEFGDIVLLYVFMDRSTIVITTTRETFLEVSKRMSGSRTVR